ncbi:hypothetical protein V1478_016646 [Vespula squamosa]|uniref:Uncharacterized protein n=1 Tax=Vespula squamosa TaxID=30214 RepID=A0ABD2A0D2_VESSQ
MFDGKLRPKEQISWLKPTVQTALLIQGSFSLTNLIVFRKWKTKVGQYSKQSLWRFVFEKLLYQWLSVNSIVVRSYSRTAIIGGLLKIEKLMPIWVIGTYVDDRRTTTLGSVKNISSFGRDEDEKEDEKEDEEEDEKVDSTTRRNPTSALTLACAIKTTFHSTLRIFRASCGHVDAWWP